MVADKEGIEPALFMNFTIGINQTQKFETAGGLLWMSVEGDYQRAACIGIPSCVFNKNIRGDIVFFTKYAVLAGQVNEEMKSNVVGAADQFVKEFLMIYARAKRQAD